MAYRLESLGGLGKGISHLKRGVVVAAMGYMHGSGDLDSVRDGDWSPD